MIVLHYTGMPDCRGRARPADLARGQGLGPLSASTRTARSSAWSTRRSAPGTPASRCWRGITDVNSASVGIEIVNPGHEFGYRPFPDEQIAALIPLVADIKERHGIGRGNVVGHSDVAPARKEDPGELFPWDALARRRLALPSPTRDLIDPYWTDAGFLLALERFGYDVTRPAEGGDRLPAPLPARPDRRRSSTANAGPSCSRCCCRGRNNPLRLLFGAIDGRWELAS